MIEGKNEKVSSLIKEFIDNADMKARNYTLQVEEIVSAFRGALWDCWTDAENFDYRLRNIVRQCLNQKGLYSIGGGEYYDIQNGTDESKIALIIKSQMSDISARVTSLNKKKNSGITAGQFYFEINENGDVEVKEYVV